MLAVHKPSGLAVHRSRLVGNAPAMVQALRDAIGRYVYPVHRLDRQTSGLILFALTAEAARGLCEQFREQRVRKTYLGVVRGWPDDTGLVDHAVPSSRGAARQPAATAYRCLARVEVPIPCGPYATSRYALLELHPRSGRQHQLRRHLKHIAHPIVGDTEYGDGRHNRLFREQFGVRRLLLQSVCLEFVHPVTGLPLRLECAPEAELVRLFPGTAWPATVAPG
jgi:tRNA pseudouridine65 synthase